MSARERIIAALAREVELKRAKRLFVDMVNMFEAGAITASEAMTGLGLEESVLLTAIADINKR